MNRLTPKTCIFMALFSFLISVGKSKLIDLSYSISNETVHWPDAQPFSFTNVFAKFISDGFWFAMNDFCSGEHMGTHMDAPYHFAKYGLTVDKIPIENLVVNAFLIDVSAKAAKNRSYEISVEDVKDLKTSFDGALTSNSVLLLKTGWSKYWPDTETYLGHKTDVNKLDFPGLGLEAAKLIASNKHIVGVGIDTASIDYGKSTEFYSHRMLQAHGKYILENVASLDLIDVKFFKLYVLPMKIKDGTGAPCRVLAQIDEKSKDEF